MAAKNGRNPGQGRTRVTRAASPSPVTTAKGPSAASGKLAAERAPRRGAGPTKTAGPVSSKAAGKPPQVKDLSRSATGTTIAQKANGAGDRRGRRSG
jgi:hypothetical protein